MVSTLRADGSPVTSATWYDLVDGRLLLTMHDDGPRHRNLLRDPQPVAHGPRHALVPPGDGGRARRRVPARSRTAPTSTPSRWRYLGEAYRDHSYVPVTVLADVEGWHAFGFD